MADRLGDENAAARRRIELEKARLRRRQLELERPGRVGDPGAPAPAAKAMIEPLPADLRSLRSKRPFAGTLATGRTCSSIAQARVTCVSIRVSAAWEIRMLAKPARHRFGGSVAAGQAQRQPSSSSAKCCSAAIFPRPFAGLVLEDRRLRARPRCSTCHGTASPGRAAGSGRRPCSEASELAPAESEAARECG